MHAGQRHPAASSASASTGPRPDGVEAQLARAQRNEVHVCVCTHEIDYNLALSALTPPCRAASGWTLQNGPLQG